MNYVKNGRSDRGAISAASIKECRSILLRAHKRRKIHDAILRGSFRGSLITGLIACMAIGSAENILIPAVVALTAIGYASIFAIINREAVRL